jgi:hypothetical protein
MARFVQVVPGDEIGGPAGRHLQHRRRPLPQIRPPVPVARLLQLRSRCRGQTHGPLLHRSPPHRLPHSTTQHYRINELRTISRHDEGVATLTGDLANTPGLFDAQVFRHPAEDKHNGLAIQSLGELMVA